MEFALRGEDKLEVNHYTVELKIISCHKDYVSLPLTKPGTYYALGTMLGDIQTLIQLHSHILLDEWVFFPIMHTIWGLQRLGRLLEKMWSS